MTTNAPLLSPPVSVLEPFVSAGVFAATEVHLAEVVARHAQLEPGNRTHDLVLLALAVAARAPRLGHVCIELDGVADRLVSLDDDHSVELEWPDPSEWHAALAASELVSTPETTDRSPLMPLVWDGRRLYLHRFWVAETSVCDQVIARSVVPSTVEATILDAAIATAFGIGTDDRQVQAVRVAMTHSMSVIVGGPGTGKTWTIARLLMVAREVAAASDHPLSVALTAPTGKAAGRMTDAVSSLLDASDLPQATTIHRLLGARGRRGFVHDEHNPLPHDLVIVDETSMVALPLMDRLMRALRPSARLVLVGDASQLASVEAGTVLRDLVGPVADAAGHVDAPAATSTSPGTAVTTPLAGHITVLEAKHRFAADSPVAVLADAIRFGDVDGALALLRGGHEQLDWVDPTNAVSLRALEQVAITAAVTVVAAARAGDAPGALAAAQQVKVLTATRAGALGLASWSSRIERGVAKALGDLRRLGGVVVGQPLLVTANDPVNNVFNGDVGVIVDDDDGPYVAIAAGDRYRQLPIARLAQIEPWWAMTIHKSQGSEFDHVIVSLPSHSSPVLTRELLYTAITRGKPEVTVVATEAALREAIGRPVSRASGLRERLWGPEAAT